MPSRPRASLVCLRNQDPAQRQSLASSFAIFMLWGPDPWPDPKAPTKLVTPVLKVRTGP